MKTTYSHFNCNPDIITVAFDPEGTGPDTHYKVLQVVYQATNYYRKEIRSGGFSRSFTLPARVDKNKIKATYKDGVLQLTLPKAPEEKEKEVKIEIK